jgi:hypothetical protein
MLGFFFNFLVGVLGTEAGGSFFHRFWNFLDWDVWIGFFFLGLDWFFRIRIGFSLDLD